MTNHKKSKLAQVYESPDKGETVYVREVLSKERKLYSESPAVKTFKDELDSLKMWAEIRQLSQTNPALKDALNKVMTIYNLIKKR
jgi:hypothetical protein